MTRIVYCVKSFVGRYYMIEKDSERLRQRILRLTANGSNGVFPESLGDKKSFASLLETFVHLEFTEQEAIEHWGKILDNMEALSEKIGRRASVYLSLVDYFTNENHALNSPMLVEVHVFRQTERLAMIDGLTGIFNRRYMDLILRKEFNRCDRYGKALSICIIDIDDFKAVNDSRGHLFGDEVLREIASLIRGTLREEDILCRYGGEEFLLILPETDAEGAFTLAERIRNTVNAVPFFKDNGITFSGGTATYPSSAYDMISLLEAADRALYQAKFSGKDCIAEATEERRKFGRYPRSWDIVIYHEKETAPRTGLRTQNVSLGGLQFESATSFCVDSSMRFVFVSLDEGGRDVEIPGKITWVKKLGNKFLYGVAFLEAPREIEAKLDCCEHTLQEA